MAEKNPYFGATFAERKAARLAAQDEPDAADTKAVDPDEPEVEDKALISSKTTRKRAPRKRG